MSGMTEQQRRLELRDRLYGENDLSKLELFAGSYINFGYWRSVPANGPLTIEHRVVSEESLYRLVLEALEVQRGDRLLEVGCGLGRGTALAAEEYPAASICGVDLLPVQVQRAQQLNDTALIAMPRRLSYQVGSAEHLPFADESLDGVYSVEAAQHFEDLAGFAREAFRVLASGGRLSLASFLLTDPGHAEALAERLETFAQGIDLPHAVSELLAELRAAGFTGVAERSIGSWVFPGFDRWLARTPHAGSWVREWLCTYRDGLIDYYLVTARKD